MATTAAEKLRIATHFILQSPTGQIDQVLRDVRVLLGSDASVLGKSQMEAILTKYNQTQFVFAPSPDSSDHNILCCSQALVEGSVYLDPIAKKHYKFDNINRTWSADNSRPKALNSNIEQYRILIQDAVQKYASSTYLDPNKYATGVFANDQGEIVIIISAKNVALHNFWSGSWRGTFTMNAGKQGSTHFAARIKINVHYFEDGNVQLNTDFNQTESIKVEDPAATAAAVYELLDSIESEFQNKLEEFYVEMHKYTFTGMRRFLPVTRNPMDWNPNAHKLAAQLKN